MNFKPFKVDVVSFSDATEVAWLTSKPTIKYENKEELDATINEMIKQDLPLSAFKQYHLRIESSILFRDLLFTLRPCIAWSSSFRINPIVPDRIFIESGDYDKSEELLMDEGMFTPYTYFKEGVALDIVKRFLYLGTMTQYTISIDSRTLMCFIATLHDLDPKGLACHILELCHVLGYDSFEELPSTSASSLLNKLMVKDNTDYSEGIPGVNYPISEYKQDELGFGTLDAIIDASTGGQFLRQHFSIVKCQLFDRVKAEGYKNVCMYKCLDKFRYISCGQVENFAQLVRRRSCWVVHWDHEYDKSEIISWADILKPFVDKLTPHEFAKLLPCRLAYQNCSVSEETRLRLWKQKGIEGVVPDENPCCPILVGDPKMVEERRKFYNSDSCIMNKWKALVENNLIRKKDTKWKQEYEK